MTDPETIPANDKWLELVKRLHTWKRGNERAVHKPLLILMLLARAPKHEENKLSYSEIRTPLSELLVEFGPPRKTQHPENPFWYLRSDGIWIVENEAEIRRKKDGRSVSSGALLEANAQGRVREELWNELLVKPDLILTLANRLLEEYWPETLHSSIRNAVGLNNEVPSAGLGRRSRDPRFRDSILRAYERRCAVCGYDGRLGLAPLGIEAAHIKWHAYGGPDDIENGEALCTFHHLALDSGALGLTVTGKIQISTDIAGNEEVERLLFKYAGHPFRKPNSAFPSPSHIYVRWHESNVFKGPSRQWESSDGINTE